MKVHNAEKELQQNREPHRKDMLKALHTNLLTVGDSLQAEELRNYYNELKKNVIRYMALIYTMSRLKVRCSYKSSFRAITIRDAQSINGYEILNK